MPYLLAKFKLTLPQGYSWGGMTVPLVRIQDTKSALGLMMTSTP